MDTAALTNHIEAASHPCSLHPSLGVLVHVGDFLPVRLLEVLIFLVCGRDLAPELSDVELAVGEQGEVGCVLLL